MITLLFFALLATALFAPPLLLSKREARMSWIGRYFLSAIPLAFTGTGWTLGTFAYDLFGCQGGLKHLHDCLVGGFDLAPLVGYGFFLGIVCPVLGAPISLWLLLNTAAKQIGSWHLANFPKDAPKDAPKAPPNSPVDNSASSGNP